MFQIAPSPLCSTVNSAELNPRMICAPGVPFVTPRIAMSLVLEACAAFGGACPCATTPEEPLPPRVRNQPHALALPDPRHILRRILPLGDDCVESKKSWRSVRECLQLMPGVHVCQHPRPCPHCVVHHPLHMHMFQHDTRDVVHVCFGSVYVCSSKLHHGPHGYHLMMFVSLHGSLHGSL